MLYQYNNHNKETLVHQLLKVQAQVMVSPIVKDGKPRVYCINSAIQPCCNCNKNRCWNGKNTKTELNGRCTFTLTQLLCIEIPISIDVDVDTKGGIVCCGKPELGPCHYCQKQTDDIYEENDSNQSDED